MDLYFVFLVEKFIFEISFEDKEVAQARIMASRFERSKGMAIDSRTFIASTQAR